MGYNFKISTIGLIMRIPEEFINRKDVKVTISEKTNSIDIEFSQRLKDEFAKWPTKKAKDIMSDIKNDIYWAFMFTPVQADTLDHIYYRVFVTLRQVY